MAEYSPYADVRRLNAVIKFGLIDTSAADIGVASSNGAAYPSQIDQVQTNGVSVQKFNTLEGKSWMLDGTGIMVPPDVSDYYTGWWSESLSNDNAVYDTPPELIFTFPSDVSCIGFTLNFNPTQPYSVPTSVQITAYDANNDVVSDGTYNNSALELMAEQPSANIRKVVFKFLSSWMPRRRVRVDGVTFGVIAKFDDDKIVSFTTINEISKDMSSLPASKLVFVVDNSEKQYNMVNPESMYRFLQDNQHIDCSIKINGHEEDLGKFLFVSSSAENDGLTASIVAGSYVYPLDNSRYNIGESGTWTFAEAVQAIKDESGLDFDVDIPSEIGSRTVGKAIPRNTKNRTALALFAQAARCVVYFDKNNVLKATDFEIGENTVDSFDENNTESLSDISLNDRINKIVITVRDDYAETERTYSKQHAITGESIRSKTFDNPVVVDGADVAQWLYDIYQRRVVYDVPSRGNPALNVIDDVSVANIYGVPRTATITKITTVYGKGLSQNIQLLGGVWE